MTDTQSQSAAHAESVLDGLVPDAAPVDFETERLHRKQRLAGGLRTLGRLRFAESVPGHVTVRDPEFPHHFWVNPFGRSFKLMRVSDLICVNEEGEVIYGDQPLNQAAFAIHSAIHKARPDVIAAAHCHSMYGKTFSAMGRELRMITQDSTMFYNDVGYTSVGSGAVVLTEEVGQALAAALGNKKALVHQNHGLITAGGSVDAAVWWFMALDRACQSQLIAESAGEPIDIPHELAQSGFESQGSDEAGWFQFQPFWDELMALEPDFLE